MTVAAAAVVPMSATKSVPGEPVNGKLDPDNRDWHGKMDSAQIYNPATANSLMAER